MTVASHRLLLNVLHCVHCGTANKLSDSSASVGYCANCKERPVEALAVLGAFDLWSGDASRCPACQTKNALWHQYCFGCGKKIGG